MAEASLYAPICPHDSIEEIFSDIYMVRGSIRLNAASSSRS